MCSKESVIKCTIVLNKLASLGIGAKLYTVRAQNFSNHRRDSLVKVTCLPNVTEIGDWLQPYVPYGWNNTNFFFKSDAQSDFFRLSRQVPKGK